MSWLALGLGLVLVIEGLVFALLPGRLDQLLAAMATLTCDQRRFTGLVAVVLGTALVGLARMLGL